MKNNIYLSYIHAFETPCTKRTESFALHMHNPVYGKQREGRHIGFYSALPFFRAVRCVLCPTRFARSFHPGSSCALAISAGSLFALLVVRVVKCRSARSKCRKCIVRNGRVSPFRFSHRRRKREKTRKREKEKKPVYFRNTNFYCRRNVIDYIKCSRILF